MAINIKNQEQIEKMRVAGQILARLDEILKAEIKPGVTTAQLDKIAEEYIRSQNAVPSFKGYGGFPGSICVSVNEEVIHGIPGKRKLQAGDIVSIDMGSYIGGFHGDCARTYGVGEIAEKDQKLIDVTKQSFFEGIKFAKVGYHLNDIASAIQDYVESFGFGVVRDYVGHGIGKNLHEDPAVPNYRSKHRGVKLQKGMVLAIEPMVTEGTYEIEVLEDDWTVITADGLRAAQYENTVLITDGEPEILTL